MKILVHFKKIILTIIILTVIFTLISFNKPGILAIDKKSKKFLKNKIDTLNRLLNEKIFIVKDIKELSENKIEKYFVRDSKTLLEMKIRLFYIMGKIHGYAVFLNRENNFAIIDNANLKLIFHSKYFTSRSKTFFIKINKNIFRELVLNRGDKIIAFPINNIKYGKALPEGITISVKAECFQLETSTSLYIY